MTKSDKLVLVMGATGQQGGATARALRRDGFRVRALVRDLGSSRALLLSAIGVELVAGDMRDRDSLAAAMRGAHGVFSIQPSSGQPQYGVTDEDELRIGTTLVDLARDAGVQHFVYTSMAGLRSGTGIGHFESKWQIEQHVRASGLRATIVRPSAFMELLLEPHFGLPQRRLTFFLRADRSMQFIAAEDIGALVACVFREPERYAGQTIELAGDTLTGRELADTIGRATGAEISYSRFPDEVLAQSPLLRRLVEVVDEGAAVGDADVERLRVMHPGLLTLRDWLERGGAAEVRSRFV